MDGEGGEGGTKDVEKTPEGYRDWATDTRRIKGEEREEPTTERQAEKRAGGLAAGEGNSLKPWAKP